MICNERIWITGASSGIGYAVAQQLAQQGNVIIASGRNEQALNTLAQTSNNIIPLVCDLTLDDQHHIHTQLCQQVPNLDRIILSAGDCQYLDVGQDDWSCIHSVMDINFHGSIRAVQAALGLLEKSARGHIVGITSMATMAPFTQAQAYGASKAAFSYFLSSLRIDLASKNIDVTDVMPGFIDTPLTQKNDFSMPFLISAEDAGKRIVKAIEKRPFSTVFPRRLYWLFKLLTLFPKLWLSMNRPKNA